MHNSVLFDQKDFFLIFSRGGFSDRASVRDNGMKNILFNSVCLLCLLIVF